MGRSSKARGDSTGSKGHSYSLQAATGACRVLVEFTAVGRCGTQLGWRTKAEINDEGVSTLRPGDEWTKDGYQAALARSKRLQSLLDLYLHPDGNAAVLGEIGPGQALFLKRFLRQHEDGDSVLAGPIAVCNTAYWDQSFPRTENGTSGTSYLQADQSRYPSNYTALPVRPSDVRSPNGTGPFKRISKLLHSSDTGK
jgi:hypothetical protein